MRKRKIIVDALWDEQAGVWVATSDDVPGLIVEEDSFEAMDRTIREMMPQLLATNTRRRRLGFLRVFESGYLINPLHTATA